jgi:tetratricopeptide (TPR) repeat protein
LISYCNKLLALGSVDKLEERLVEVDQIKAIVLRESPAREQGRVFSRLGGLHARMGHWSEAADYFSTALQKDPGDHWTWFQQAPLLLQAGNLKQYRQHCHDMIARFGSVKDPTLAERTAKACLLLPPDGDIADAAYSLVERAISSNPNRQFLDWFQLIKSLGDYRRGSYLSSAHFARQALTRPRDAIRDVYGYAILSMAEIRLGQRDDAYTELDKALEIAMRDLPPDDSKNLGDGWHDVLICRLMLREAKTVLREDANPSSAK